MPYDWLKKFYSFYMAATVNIIGRLGLIIKAGCRNLLYLIRVSYIALYKFVSFTLTVI